MSPGEPVSSPDGPLSCGGSSSGPTFRSSSSLRPGLCQRRCRRDHRPFQRWVTLLCAEQIVGGDRILDRRDPAGVEAPWLVDTDVLVQIPHHTVLAWLRDQRPSDDRPAKLLTHRVGGRREAGGCAALRMVMEKCTVGLLAERRISCGAQSGRAMPHRRRATACRSPGCPTARARSSAAIAANPSR